MVDNVIMRRKIDNVNDQGFPSTDDVLEAIHAVTHLLRARHHQALRDGGSELTPLEARALGFFARHPGATQGELAAHSGRDKGQIARLLQGLRERGLLQATADEHDRRITRLQLTDTAKAQMDAVQRLRKRLARSAASGLEEPERRTLVELLRRVHQGLSTGR